MFQNSCRFRSRSDLVNPSDLPLIEKNPTPPHSFYARLISRVSFSWCTIFCFDGIASSHPFADISLPFTSQSPFQFACQAINSVNASKPESRPASYYTLGVALGPWDFFMVELGGLFQPHCFCQESPSPVAASGMQQKFTERFETQFTYKPALSHWLGAVLSHVLFWRKCCQANCTCLWPRFGFPHLERREPRGQVDAASVVLLILIMREG